MKVKFSVSKGYYVFVFICLPLLLLLVYFSSHFPPVFNPELFLHGQSITRHVASRLGHYVSFLFPPFASFASIFANPLFSFFFFHHRKDIGRDRWLSRKIIYHFHAL